MPSAGRPDSIKMHQHETAPLIATDAAALEWLQQELGVSRETMAALECYVALLRAEAGRQNLVARSTLDTLWARHIVDSAQLLTHAPQDYSAGPWLDLGSGPGLPGLVVAICTGKPIILVESRRRRVEFLHNAIEALGLGDVVTVFGGRLEAMERCKAAVITARAFAPLPKLLSLAGRFSTENTIWILPKGKNAVNELEALPKNWQRLFHVKQSLTDPEAGILLGQGRINT